MLSLSRRLLESTTRPATTAVQYTEQAFAIKNLNGCFRVSLRPVIRHCH